MTRASHIPGQSDGRSSGTGYGENRELDLFDVIALAWSERFFIILVFAAIFAVGATLSLTQLKPSYEAESRLIVLLDEDPTPAAAGLGGAFMLDQVLQSESQLLSSDSVRRLALETLGAEAILGRPVEGNAQTAALRTLRGGFSLSRAPNSTTLNVRFEADDPERAALVLNAIVDAYLSYREQVLVETGVSGLTVRRAQANEALAAAQGELDTFLIANDLSDFENEQQTTENLVRNLTERVNSAEAERDAAMAGAAALRARLQQIPENIELYVENGVAGLLLDRRAERASLLARYQPGAPAVLAIDREIEAIQDFIASGATEGQGQRRTGVNPVRQSLESELATREANARSQASLAASLERQLQESRTEIARLRALEPEYTRIAQDLAAAEQTAASIAALESSASARRVPGLGAADAVRLIDRASPPLDGSSMKKLGFIASFVLAGGVALFLGLLRGYWRTYVRQSVMPVPVARRDGPGPVGRRYAAEPVEAVAREPWEDLPVLARIPDRSA